MARLDDLIAEIRDPILKQNLQDAIADAMRGRSFGLVFQEHVPETSVLLGFPIHVGAIVQRREQAASRVFFRVKKINGRGKLVVESLADHQEHVVNSEDLLTVKRFGDPIYPCLVPVGAVRRGSPDRPCHAVINGENFHTLQLFTYLYAGKIDCIYIDPPYNSGARDWKYNNNYVDSEDAYRHSKWLAFIDRRLKLAKELLNPDNSVLIVTIDEKEYLRLGLLLQQTFPGSNVQMISTVISPSGAARNIEFTRVNEYVFFVMIGNASPCKTIDDMLFTEYRAPSANKSPIWNSLRRLGAGPTRADSPSKFYPILVDGAGRIVGAGEPLPLGISKDTYSPPPRATAVWPSLTNGDDARWELRRSSFLERLERGYVRVSGTTQSGGQNVQYLRNAQIERLANGELVSSGKAEDGSLVIDYAPDRPRSLYAKTVWNKPSHDSRTYGTWVLREFIPGRQFPFPKSLYAVEDALRFFVKDKPDALILDFFAGSGTTAHAVFRLNHQDGGRRRSIMVTNNEISDEESKRLRKEGHFPGDAEWESLGIFDYIARPRIAAAIAGRTLDGDVVEGEYEFTDKFPMSDGFAENVEFFRVAYLDPDDVDLGRQFDAILPALWLAAGGIGDRETGASTRDYSIPDGSTYGVLFRESAFRKFKTQIVNRPNVTHVWLVTDSEEAFAEMCSSLPRKLTISMLYRDYLRNFRINTRRQTQ